MHDDAPVIRSATAADVAEIAACVAAAYAPYLARMATPPAPMLDDYVALVDRGVVEVAVHGDRLAGVIVMWAEPDHFFIDNVAVAPWAQGTGTGRLLLEHASVRAVEAGHHELRLYTNEAMTENLAYYPRQGFVETHRAVGDGYARVYFSKPLAGHPEAD